jgi:hypothetical protein
MGWWTKTVNADAAMWNVEAPGATMVWESGNDYPDPGYGIADDTVYVNATNHDLQYPTERNARRIGNPTAIDPDVDAVVNCDTQVGDLVFMK